MIPVSNPSRLYMLVHVWGSDASTIFCMSLRRLDNVVVLRRASYLRWFAYGDACASALDRLFCLSSATVARHRIQTAAVRGMAHRCVSGELVLCTVASLDQCSPSLPLHENPIVRVREMVTSALMFKSTSTPIPSGAWGLGFIQHCSLLI